MCMLSVCADCVCFACVPCVSWVVIVVGVACTYVLVEGQVEEGEQWLLCVFLYHTVMLVSV